MSRFDPALVARALAAVLASRAGQPAQRGRALEIAMALARRFEGLRLRPYLCPAGVPTIGYGATTYLDGRAVSPGDPAITPAGAERLLERQMAGTFLPSAQRLCPTADTAGRVAALADFAFNLGPTRLKASTLRRRVLAGDWAGAAVELRRWVRGGGRVLPGLVLRREAEIALLGGPHETTR
ncbi:MAG: lysozyme [Aquabacterium sp.]|nr:lysozyme [Aquabacterium sp.]